MYSFMFLFKYFPPLWLGWALGANGASYSFGTAVATRVVRYRTAIILISIFAIIGALLEGEAGIKTISSISNQTIASAGILSLSAAFSVTIMTYFRLPVSITQAVIGSIIGIGLLKGGLEWGGLWKVIIGGVATPLGAIVIAMIVYKILGYFYNKISSYMLWDRVLKISFIIAGCYGAYSLGANNVANITGVYVSNGMMTPFTATLFGGLSIAFGVLTYSRNVMFTIGKDIVHLDSFSAFIVILAEAITVHIYALLGIPVPISQATVGAVIGIGLLKGVRTVNKRTVINIGIGWVSTPLISGFVSYLVYFIFRSVFV